MLLGIIMFIWNLSINDDSVSISKVYGIYAQLSMETDCIVDSITYLYIELSDSLKNKLMSNQANYKEEVVIIYNGKRKEFTLEEFFNRLDIK